MKINIVNKYKHEPEVADVYIGKGSALGNPYAHAGMSKIKRDEVCDKYEVLLRDKYTNSDAMKAQLNHIYKVHQQFGHVNLVCFCKPFNRCHGESIKRLMLELTKDL